MPVKPSDNEDEYFARQEIERKKAEAKKRADEMAAKEREQLQQLHFMKCPKCGMDLQTIEFQGIKVDKCGSCNGTWFDDGEIEQLMKNDPGFVGRVMSIFR